MDVNRPGGADLPQLGGQRAAAGAPGGDPAQRSTPGAAPAPSGAPPALERVDIQALDAASALRIFVAEVRAAFGLPADAAAAPYGAVAAPQAAAVAVVDAFLARLPQDAGTVDSWLAANQHAAALLDAGMARGTAVVAAWRDVAADVVDTVGASSALIVAVLGEELDPAVLLRPEWLGLAPRVSAFRRRRRAARRHPEDPDGADPRGR